MDNTNNIPIIALKDLAKVGVPFSLRRDDLADTYLSTNQTVYVVPRSEHDFSAMVEFSKLGLSISRPVKFDDGRQAVAYPKQSELVSFSALLSSSIDDEEGQRFITEVALKLRRELEAIKDHLGALPNIDNTDDIVFDRTTGRVEILPPYLMDKTKLPQEVIDSIQQSAMKMFAESPVLAGTVHNCFMDAREAYDE